MKNIKISIIIPVYNEEKTIETFLKDLKIFKDKCEIIVIDGGSKDETFSKIPNWVKFYESEKGRGNQLNLGAKKSTGDVIFFLHADSKIPINFTKEIYKVMEKHVVGCFGIKFNTNNITMKCIAFFSNIRAKYGRIIFGDQGMFIKRELFFKLGGFKNIPIMEDYDFSCRMKKENLKIGMTESKIITSSRRFPKTFIGKINTILKMYNLRKSFRKGVSVYEIANKYKDIR